MDIGAITEMLLVLKVSLFFVIATAVLGVGNSEHATAGNINIRHGGRKLAEIPGFISIDCGSNEDYIEEATGISYVTDKGFIDTGVAETASPNLSANYVQPLKNLRSFPQGKRNCYSLRPEQGKNNKFLIRARFLYGNYDGKNQAPEFEIYLGINKWTTIKGTDGHNYDIIHLLSTDYIDVCLVNTGQGVPFISALELRRLDNSIYPSTAGGALGMHDRRDFGSTGPIIRYRDDVYDRFWWPEQSESWIPVSSVSTIYTNSTDNAYELPPQVLKTASKTQNASIALKVSWTALDTLSKYYVYLHFAEIEKLEPGQQRELTIDLNGERNLSDSFKLDYLKPLTIAQDDPPISGSGTLYVSINAAQGTTIPPILNAYEIYLLVELQNKPTAPEDVTAMLEIKTQYSVTKNWQGDPCAPSDYSWEGLNCSDDNPPRVISLNLSSSNLTGEIATSFFKLELIQSLDLSFNDLTGPLPEVLEQLPNLKTLDLRGNKLTGPVPEALLEQFRNGKLDLRVDANPDLCLYTPCKGKKKKEFFIPVLAASITAVLILLFIVSALAMYRRKRGSDMVAKSKSSIKSKNRQYSYSEVVKITNNFRTIIGKGGFGNVYLGKLKDEIQVAVKLLSPSSNQGYKEFRAEAQLLMVLHHGNLVTLVGYCDDGEKKALIYEYMAKGNLQQHLSVTNPNVLTWKKRLCIAVDAAHGLEYLHNGCKPPIIHRDLKPPNILLNDQMQAKIADFGLSRAFANENDTHVSTCPAGTFGYVDPEFAASGNFRKESDVYSFGIILFELITGRPAIIRGPMQNDHILDWVYPLIEMADIQNIVDPRLEGEFSTTSAWKVVEIAMSCALPVAIQRPDMSQVLVELKECLALIMTHGRSQLMATECITSSMPHNTFHLELESEFAPVAR
ncbi:putative leucine-rich repeat receptor-like serine/threonine-protein kinase At2g19230 [Juglans microcarpa x Juglans regia]|uniref:putative leucine-rich repeat receptor-like serine/threonine-protein kinase At2g19230 n=1 Tax=Juglans microcarpa x Juglans regia TaxID=2249226 RepID=UPI001B7EF446|nr:putative leucine-rich repeat receptor-like serine/threonine-protein kinase At2g19230 [Juglans microcarpa x Juglans regia]